MDQKQVFIGIFLFSLIIFSFSVISADNLQDFLDSSQIIVTVNQNQSWVDFSLNTFGTSFDHQQIDIRNQTIADTTINQLTLSFDISKLLGDINGQVKVDKNSDIAHFNDLSITNIGNVSVTKVDIEGITPIGGGGGSVTFTTGAFLQTLLNRFSLGIDVTNRTNVNNYLSSHPLPIASDRHLVFTKQGTEYTIWNDEGYGDVPENWKVEIRKIINESVQQINIKDILDNFLPMLKNESEFQVIWNQLNLNFTVTDIDLSSLDLNTTFQNVSSIKLKDGTYIIPITVSDGTNSYTKDITLKIEGIQNTATGSSNVDGTYTPTNEEVKRYLKQIKGLGNNTVSVVIFDVKPAGSILPSNTKKVIKYMEINVTNSPNGTINFKIPIEDISNHLKVSLYVLSGNNWVELSTSFEGTFGGFYEYSAETPHFSTFMIMETESSSSSSKSSKKSNDNYQFGTVAPESPTSPQTPEPIDLGGPANGQGFFAGITGAFIGALGTGGSVIVIVFIVAIVGLMILLRIKRDVDKKKKKLNEKGDKDER